MPEKRTAPCGSWRSPITSDLIVSGSISLSQIQIDGDDAYWLEGRPSEAGRQVIVRRAPNGRTEDMNAAPFNARSRVHEYGGGAYCVSQGIVFFSNFADNIVYRREPDGRIEPITRDGALRYADFTADQRRKRLLSVREDHRDSTREAINTLVAIDDSGPGEDAVLVQGNDFYSSPRLSTDGSRLAWLTWNHPNMPWDGCELWIADMAADGTVAAAMKVAGGERESIFQPEWSDDGSLYFVSDQSGWWNLWRFKAGSLEQLTDMEAEFGVPSWVFGMSTYALESSRRLICSINQNSRWHLASLDTVSGRLLPIESPHTCIDSVRAGGGKVAFVGGSPTSFSAVELLDLASQQFETLKQSNGLSLDEIYLSTAQSIEFPTERDRVSQAFFYPPRNGDYSPWPDELPPLIVHCHGGPTGQTSGCLSLGVQFWTSRGFAVLDVNYGGSTGYGRAYRERLNGEWGVVDVDDCVNGARYLSNQGKVDPNRLIIVGGSAGGYTTLCALTFREAFTTGASHFGIGDLEPFVHDTHKFESRYIDRLIGPYPETKDLYYERSPINFPDRLSRPVILFQGLDDKVVPPNQAEIMTAALQRKGIPFAYVAFEGEGHGFRKAENVKRALDGELYFYSRILNFDLAEEIEPVPIENLDSAAPAATSLAGE